jgi:hypothetical protein
VVSWGAPRLLFFFGVFGGGGGRGGGGGPPPHMTRMLSYDAESASVIIRQRLLAPSN